MLRRIALVKIRFIPDLHYFDENELADNEKDAFNHYIDHILDRLFHEEADFYVSLGDLVNYGNQDEAEQIYRKIDAYQKRFFHVFGNHDIFKMARKDWPNRYHISNKHLEFKDCLFIFLDTARELDEENYSGYLSPKTAEWLEEVLIESKDKPVVIFAHHGVPNTTRLTHKDMLRIQDTDIESLLKIKKTPSFFLHGHNHHDSIVKEGNWTFIQGSCEIDSPTVREIIIDNEKLLYSTENLMTKEMKEWHNVFYKERKDFSPMPTGPGTRLEQNGVFDL